MKNSKSIRMRGLSLVEVVVVLAMVLIGASVAIVHLGYSLKIVNADRASSLISSQLQYARQVAVNQRRSVLVQFLGTGEIKVVRQDGAGATTVLSDVFLPDGFSYSEPAGIEINPDVYSGAAVNFNLGNSGTFLSDGVFISDSGIVMNGTVFTMGGTSGNTRAVTLTGASGRLRTYRLGGVTWLDRT